jgi:hypothetical protein
VIRIVQIIVGQLKKSPESGELVEDIVPGDV